MSSTALLRRGTFRLGAGVLAAALIGAAGVAGLGASAASAADPAPATPTIEYVALGDSYSAGYGLTPPTGLPVIGCGQSALNYPHQIAAALGLNLTDVSCSGAVTANIVDTPQLTPAGTNDVQSLALSETTDIVTVTIGGNDLGFSSIIAACMAASPDGPTLGTASAPTPMADCKSIFTAGGVDALAAKVQFEVAPKVASTFALIHEMAPNAKIFVLAYPALMPDAANTPVVPSGCFIPVADGTGFVTNSYPFTKVDVPYLNGVQSLLDTAIKGAADGVGATYVPMFTETLAHTPCAGTAEPYLNGITLTSLAGAMVPGAMHPNVAGMAFMAQQAQAQIQAAITAPVFTSGAPTDGIVGTGYSFAATSSGFPAPIFAINSGALPAGLSLDPNTGVITGTPTEAGNAVFTVTATNGVGTATSPEYTITVTPANFSPTITSGTPSQGKVGVAYAFTVTADGYPAPGFAVTSGALPNGLALNTTTGAITGVPTASGTSSFAITASNEVRPAATANYTLMVQSATVPVQPEKPAKPAPVTTQGLAATGVDMVSATTAGLLLLLAGASLVTRRRKSAR